VRLARRLVDPVALGRDPVVLQVAPLAGDRVREHLLRVIVPVHHARALGHEDVAPAVLAGGDEQRPAPRRRRQRRVPAFVQRGGILNVRFRGRAGPEDLRDRLQLAPELVCHVCSSSSAAHMRNNCLSPPHRAQGRCDEGRAGRRR
jgi:hypothetical protein